jgi:hypothetical protein
MNTKNLILASLVGGAVSLIVANVPYISLVNLLLCVGFWGSAVLAVWLYFRMTGSVTLGQAVAIGTLAGFWAGLFGFLLSFIGLAGASALLNSYKSILPADAAFQMPPEAGMAFTIGGVCFDIVFGAIGGLVGGLIFRNRNKPAAG